MAVVTSVVVDCHPWCVDTCQMWMGHMTLCVSEKQGACRRRLLNAVGSFEAGGGSGGGGGDVVVTGLYVVVCDKGI